MPAEKTLAFVLKTRDYRDTSLMTTFFTKRFGKVKAIIKGGRDARGRLGSSLEPFSLNEIMVYLRKKGDLHLVTAAELENRYDDIRFDIDKLGYASYFMELIDQLTDSAPHEDIFQLIQDVFLFMRKGHSLKRASRIFEIKLMHALGHMPELGQCVHCSSSDWKDGFYFSIHSGGVVCHACRTKEHPLMIVPKGTLTFLKAAKKKHFEELEGVKVSQEVGEKLEQIMRQFIDHHLDYRPKSLIFMDKLNLAERQFQNIDSQILSMTAS